MTNKARTFLYTGVTSDIRSRAAEHKAHTYPDSFSARYLCHYLVWHEQHATIEAAIVQEKRVKGGSRKWTDLYETLM